ncbi:hypothetical protein GGR54DRAFT_635273 [Hypoxylon sp. NC1633]|nr:hypothetical protein GGR54DRAFT_635273 [Hypoxylon sp. NC1633]
MSFVRREILPSSPDHPNDSNTTAVAAFAGEEEQPQPQSPSQDLQGLREFLEMQELQLQEYLEQQELVEREGLAEHQFIHYLPLHQEADQSQLHIQGYPSQQGTAVPTPAPVQAYESSEEWETELEEESEVEWVPPAFPTEECDCACHKATPLREARPQVNFLNIAYVACPMCWVDAYMHALDGRWWAGTECDAHLRSFHLDPLVPARQQCEWSLFDVEEAGAYEARWKTLVER